jgi:hypothetical protein
VTRSEKIISYAHPLSEHDFHIKIIILEPGTIFLILSLASHILQRTRQKNQRTRQILSLASHILLARALTVRGEHGK